MAKSKQSSNPVSKKIDSRFLPLVLDVVNHGIFTVDKEGNITSFNQAAEKITGYSEREVLGHQCSEVFQTLLCNTECPLKRSIHSRDRIRSREVVIQTKHGRSKPIAVSTAPLETKAGRLLGGVEVFNDLSSLHGLRRKLSGKYRFDDIISKNPEMHHIFSLLPLAAESDSTILVAGASGTGKELVAKAIHNHSSRGRKPFVAVNCAALPETLLESELFGYKKGAFTDAKSDKPGRIAQAEGGTLFIDEVGDLPKVLQVKLLRFLQERSYEPLGSARSIQADVRVIAASNQELEPLVHEGSFREDLYYRLNVLQITLPPLNRRAEDIPLLVQHFIEHFNLTMDKAITGITSDALAALMKYQFPGNVRELENIVERAFILCRGSEISTADLSRHVLESASATDQHVMTAPSKMEAVEADAIRTALRRHRGNRTRAARELGIHRSTLVRKLKRYHMA